MNRNVDEQNPLEIYVSDANTIELQVEVEDIYIWGRELLGKNKKGKEEMNIMFRRHQGLDD